MEEKKRVVPVGVTVIFVILCVGAICVNCLRFSVLRENWFIPGAIIGGDVIACDVLACIMALVYCCLNYSKFAADIFTAFCGVFALSTALTLYSEAAQLTYYSEAAQLTFIVMMLLLIRFGILCIFMVARDLGKKKSFVMAIILIVCELLQFIHVFGDWGLVGIQASKVVLAAVFLFMVSAKYADKALRGSK